MNPFRNISVTESEKLKKGLFACVLVNRCRDFKIVRGRDRGRVICYQLLVDLDKRQRYNEQIETGYIYVPEFGILLESSWGHEIPQSFNNRQDQFYEDLAIRIKMVKFQKEGYELIYYTLPLVSDDARRNNFIITASSEDEIKQIGRILYCSRDEDPVESFLEIIVQVYFGIAEYNSPNDNELLDSVRKGELQRVTTYLEGGGDVNFADEYGRSLLHLAAHSGKLELVRFLKHKGANTQTEDKLCGRKPVHIAAKEGYPSIVSFFLDNGTSVNECDKINWTPLHYAVWKGDLNTITVLIKRGAKISAKEIHADKKPIHIAAELGYNDVIKYLIENGANIEDGDFHERTPLYHSVMQGHFKTSRFLIDKGADKNIRTKFQKRTLLHAAEVGECKETIEFLVKAGLDINQKDSEGCTPLHYAAYNYRLDMLQVLDDLGADFFAVENNGKNPLEFSKKKHADMVFNMVYRMCTKLHKEGKYHDAVEIYKENLTIIKELGQDLCVPDVETINVGDMLNFLSKGKFFKSG